MFNFVDVVTGRQLFMNLYPSDHVINSLVQLASIWFNRIPAFNNPDTGYTAMQKIFFTTIGNNSVLAMQRQLLAQGVKAPYAIITNDTLSEQYSNQFLSNFAGSGLPGKLASFSVIYLSSSVPYLMQPYSTTNGSDTNITETYITFVGNYVRSNYSYEINVFANSYPELLDIQSQFTNLFTNNRYHLYYTVSKLYLPNYMILSLSNQSVTAYLQSDTMQLVNKNYFYVSITNPMYVKLTSIQNQVQPYIQTNELTTYKFTARCEFDIGIINTINVYYSIPIKGVNVTFSLANYTTSITGLHEIVNSYTSYTFSATQYYSYSSLTITIPDPNFASATSVYVYNTGTSSYTGNQFYLYLEKFLSFSIISASQIFVQDEVYPNTNIVVLYSYT